jgi:hypothetical protein
MNPLLHCVQLFIVIIIIKNTENKYDKIKTI